MTKKQQTQKQTTQTTWILTIALGYFGFLSPVSSLQAQEGVNPVDIQGSRVARTAPTDRVILTCSGHPNSSISQRMCYDLENMNWCSGCLRREAPTADTSVTDTSVNRSNASLANAQPTQQ